VHSVEALRLCTERTVHRGSRDIALLFLYHDTRRDEGSASRPVRSLPQGKSRHPLYWMLGGPHRRSGQVRKISPPPGFDSRTVQPVVSRYADYATRPTNCVWWHLIYLSPQYGPCLTSHFWRLKFWGGFKIFVTCLHPVEQTHREVTEHFLLTRKKHIQTTRRHVSEDGNCLSEDCEGLRTRAL